MTNILRTSLTGFKDKAAIKRFVIRYNLWLIILGMSIVSTVLSKGVFISPDNLFNLLLQNSIIGVLALGQFLVILTAGIDLSVGSILAASALLCAWFLAKGYGILLSILVCFGLGASLGLMNGLMISKGKIPPFIATLGMMGIARSLARQINHGSPIWAIPENFLIFGRESVGPVPVAVILWGIVFFFTLFLVERTRYGRYIYAVGANENAARISGVKIDRTKLLVYSLAGLFCAIGAMIFIARTKYAPPTAGMWYNLDSIAAVVIGGTSLFGGIGSTTNTFLGVIVVGILTNLMNILNVHIFVQKAIIGLVLIVAVYSNIKIRAR
ncbi:ribose ABC transporter permease [Candidatus Aerophobetes bacterium]|uniref:Ribose ABC transporter permease n=1 Tax=Aerophobetes bacterium TaxID=2030807 RepID=A0A662DC18_UNCAE|nr:MAG: ribose ABC transporter permease [Candidatus Aerophobetes bacterium]